MQPSPRERIQGWGLESQNQCLVDIGWTLFENLGPAQGDSCFVKLYKQKHPFPCLHYFEFLSLAPEIILINTQCAGPCCQCFQKTVTFNNVYLILWVFVSMYLSNHAPAAVLWLILVRSHRLPVTVIEDPPSHPRLPSTFLLLIITLQHLAKTVVAVDIVMTLSTLLVVEPNAALRLGFFFV